MKDTYTFRNRHIWTSKHGADNTWIVVENTNDLSLICSTLKQLKMPHSKAANTPGVSVRNWLANIITGYGDRYAGLPFKKYMMKMIPVGMQILYNGEIYK